VASCDVFCYGELGVDNIIRLPHLATPETAAFPTTDSYHIGGAAANTAVWLAGWGINVALAGNAIGQDIYGRQLLNWLSQQPHLDLRYIESHPQVATPFCRIMVTPDAERTILVYWYPQTPKTPLTVAMLKEARYLALDLYGGEERLAAARVAHRAGLQIVVGDVVSVDHSVLPLSHIVINSAAYIRECFPEIDLCQHARQLQAINRGIIIITDGPRPTYVLDNAGPSFHLQPPQVEAVDATGAGDAFRAGLMYGLLQGWPLSQSICWATATATLKVMRVGAASDLAVPAEIAKLMTTLQPVFEE
jgi:sugar/nucleoside kinase (ribokinase family)